MGNEEGREEDGGEKERTHSVSRVQSTVDIHTSATLPMCPSLRFRNTAVFPMCPSLRSRNATVVIFENSHKPFL